MANFVYFVHGIGTHAEDWIASEPDDGSTVLEQLERSWSAVKGDLGPLGQRMTPVPISYDGVFRDLYSRWASELAALETQLARFPGAAEKLKPVLAAAGAAPQGQVDDAFFYTHVLDLVWYWGTRIFRDALVARTAARIFEHLADNLAPGNHFSIVAHSMGTSVVHGVLQKLYREPQYGASLAATFKFRLLMQVANTSHALAENRATHYDDPIVRPSRAIGQGCCDVMINAANSFDLVCDLLRFEPDLRKWLDPLTYLHARDHYVEIRTPYLTGPNPHSLVHYFRNPFVYVPFFRAALGVTFAREAIASAGNAFIAATAHGRYQAVEDRLKSMHDATGPDVVDYVRTVIDYVHYLRSFGSGTP